jgi:YbgC/YbaW family acyl-CoA thioester hydrolase
MVKFILVLSMLVCGASNPDEPLDITVRSTEIDVNSHVNNAKYVEYLQWGRWDFLEKHEISRKTLKSENIALVVVNINVNYRKPANEGDHLSVRTILKSVGRSTLTFSQEIYSGDILISDAAVILVTMDTVTHKSKEVPDFLRKILHDE